MSTIGMRVLALAYCSSANRRGVGGGERTHYASRRSCRRFSPAIRRPQEFALLPRRISCGLSRGNVPGAHQALSGRRLEPGYEPGYAAQPTSSESPSGTSCDADTSCNRWFGSDGNANGEIWQSGGADHRHHSQRRRGRGGVSDCNHQARLVHPSVHLYLSSGLRWRDPHLSQNFKPFSDRLSRHFLVLYGGRSAQQ